MFLRTLYLHNFRIYTEASFDFHPHVNMIWGANAQGKTTILEAVHFLITGRSFRTSQTADLIRKGTESFFIEASFIKHGIEQKLKVSCDGKERKIFYNQTPCPSTAHLMGILQGVVVTPDDVGMIKGAPLLRRQFLDLQIAQADPLYVHHLTRYNRAMRQRNCLLRTRNHTTIESWEFEMANAAAYVTHQRAFAVQGLRGHCKELHLTLTGEADFGLEYKTGAPTDNSIEQLRHYHLEQYKKNRYRENELGYTLVGPHKDDLVITIAQKDTRYFASEGQQRSCIASMRFAEWNRLNSLASEAPLMLIDDIGVSLDDSRKDKLFQYLPQFSQIFLTSTQAISMPNSRTIRI